MSDEQDFDFLNSLDNILGNIDEGGDEFDLINELESDVQPTIALPNMNLLQRRFSNCGWRIKAFALK